MEEYERLLGEINLVAPDSADDDLSFLYCCILASTEFYLITPEEADELTQKYKAAVGGRFDKLTN